jgi:hypothetical protein
MTGHGPLCRNTSSHFGSSLGQVFQDHAQINRALGRLNERVHPIDRPVNGRSCINLAVPARYVRRAVEIDTGELASPHPAEVNDVRDRKLIASGVPTPANSGGIRRRLG